MAYYRICERCGARLDPGEHCTCEREMTRDYMIEYLDRNDRRILHRQEAKSEEEAVLRFRKYHYGCRVLEVAKA